MQKPAGTHSDKVLELDALAARIAKLRAEGKRVVHCHGVFDLLHVGHVRHFARAREFGDVLVVTLTPDQHVNKGPHRPVFNHHLRAEFVANLNTVDLVAINRWPTAVDTLKLLKPNYYVKGSEYRDASRDVTGGIQREQEAIESVGGKLVFTDDIVFSSSTLINKFMPTLPPEAAEFLEEFRKTCSADEVVGYLKNARNLKVLLLGETIIDDYHYCETLGKSGKEPILAVRYKSSEKFAGGVIAVANHAASFSDHVEVVTQLGSKESHEEFIKERLNPRIKPTFQTLEGVPTILKRRFIEGYPFQKMFEVYLMDEATNEQAVTSDLAKLLRERLPEFDLVIVTDYGHHMIHHEIVDVLVENARCLAINTQANAANHGFNTISKYRGIDYGCISESELRLEARQRRLDVRQIIEEVARRIDCKTMMVTRGRSGLLCYDRNLGFFNSPAMAGHFVDRIGAGDAVFAVTSLCMVQGASPAILGLIGNAVGAMAVGIVGNREPINSVNLKKFLTSVLK